MSGLVRELTVLYSSLEEYFGLGTGSIRQECQNLGAINHVSIIYLCLGFLVGVLFAVAFYLMMMFASAMKRTLFEEQTLPKSQELVKLAATVRAQSRDNLSSEV
jgi:hypothetical protein